MLRFRSLSSLGPRVAALVLVLLALCGARSAAAHAAGWPSEGCSGCHSGGKVPAVSITSNLIAIDPGQLVTLTVSVSAANGHGAGFYLEATAGKLSVIDSGTKLLGNGVTQSARRTGTGSATTFQVGWTAPATPGGVDFNAWGNSVNSDGSSFGDAAGDAFLSVAYGCSGTKFYHDYDGDGVGAVSSGFSVACTVPLYYSARGDDCNDAAPANFPGNPEICDGLDNNCNGQVDEALTYTQYCTDADGDGHGAAGKATVTDCAPKKGFGICDSDCNDSDPAVYPGHAEVCDGKDNNCDGNTDELLPISGYCPDADGDGHGIAFSTPLMACAKPAGYGACDNDCNDNDNTVYVGATEICDAKDNNCNNQVDENALNLCGLGWCRRAATGCNSTCTPGDPRPEECNDFDDDCDGVNDNGTDLQLCKGPGLHCDAGYCVPAPYGDAGAGGEAGSLDDAGTPIMAGGAPAASGSGGADPSVAGSSNTSGSGGVPYMAPDPVSGAPATCGFGIATTRRPWGALVALLALGLAWRARRRRR